MRRSYKFAIKPTSRQQGLLNHMLAQHCALYNAALQERRDAYRHRSATTIRYGDQSAQLSQIRGEDPDGQARWSFSSQQATLRRLDRAFAAFFSRIKAGRTPGYPRFRSHTRFDTVDFPKNGDGVRWDSQPGKKSTWTHLRVQGVGHIKVNQHRAVACRVKTVSVKREGGTRKPRWFVILSCDEVPAVPLAPTGSVVGLDMATGANGLAYTSDGDRIDNPRHLHNHSERLVFAQRALARTRRGSPARRRAAEVVARLHGKVARARLDYHHKAALALVRDHDFIAIEALRPANMTRRAKPVPDPDRSDAYLPNGGSAKTGLNKSILDAGWGIFFNVLHAKAESAGRVIVAVDPANTSRTCHECGRVDPASRSGKAFVCTGCAHSADADVNAARNILRAGLAQFSDASAA